MDEDGLAPRDSVLVELAVEVAFAVAAAPPAEVVGEAVTGGDLDGDAPNDSEPVALTDRVAFAEDVVAIVEFPATALRV